MSRLLLITSKHNKKMIFMKKIMLVFGTRPEAIKMCPIIKEFYKHTDHIQTKVVVSGQHDEMLNQVLNVFQIVPDYNLRIMKSGQSLFDITTKVMYGMKDIFEIENPDLVLVHGDTTTSFAAALSCFYMHIPVGHVEAGLRTNNIQSPWPEEFNRVVVDKVSDYYFAPTNNSKNNLLNEGISSNKIFVTGNTSIDALSTTITDDYYHPVLEWANDSKLLLLTAHRRENLGEPMHRIFRAIRRVIEDNDKLKVVYPIHMNPAVRDAAHAELDGCDRIKIIEPLDVLDFHNFLNKSYLICTDSGGIQEEAPGLGVPVLVLRDTTERPEGVSAGTLKLVGTQEESIYRECCLLLRNQDVYDSMSGACNPYGDGHASEKIVDIVLKSLGVYA